MADTLKSPFGDTQVGPVGSSGPVGPSPFGDAPVQSGQPKAGPTPAQPSAWQRALEGVANASYRPILKAAEHPLDTISGATGFTDWKAAYDAAQNKDYATALHHLRRATDPDYRMGEDAVMPVVNDIQSGNVAGGMARGLTTAAMLGLGAKAPELAEATQLPARIGEAAKVMREAPASKVGSGIGAASGGYAGYRMAGPPGGVAGAATGAIVGNKVAAIPRAIKAAATMPAKAAAEVAAEAGEANRAAIANAPTYPQTEPTVSAVNQSELPTAAPGLGPVRPPLSPTEPTSNIPVARNSPKAPSPAVAADQQLLTNAMAKRQQQMATAQRGGGLRLQPPLRASDLPDSALLSEPPAVTQQPAPVMPNAAQPFTPSTPLPAAAQGPAQALRDALLDKPTSAAGPPAQPAGDLPPSAALSRPPNADLVGPYRVTERPPMTRGQLTKLQHDLHGAASGSGLGHADLSDTMAMKYGVNSMKDLTPDQELQAFRDFTGEDWTPGWTMQKTPRSAPKGAPPQ